MKSKIKFNHTCVKSSIIARIKYHKPDSYFLDRCVTRYHGPLYFVKKVYSRFLKKFIPSSRFVFFFSTGMFIQRIADLLINNSTILATFDILSLFPFINTSEVTGNINRSIDKLNNLNQEC